jgi:hypothetical protein
MSSSSLFKKSHIALGRCPDQRGLHLAYQAHQTLQNWFQEGLLSCLERLTELSTGGRTSDPPLKPTGAVSLGGGRTRVAAASDGGRTQVTVKSDDGWTAESPLKMTFYSSSAVETDSVSFCSSISSASSSVMTLQAKMAGGAPWVV